MTDDLRSRVERILRDDVAPVLNLDGNGLEVVAVADGIASVRIGPVCAGCPATIAVLVQQLEAELRQRMPEIEILEAVA